MALADELVAEDAFTTVAHVESALQKAMSGISDADLKAEVKNQIRDVTAIRDAKEKLAPAIEKLKQSPDDAAANLAVGSYLCFLRGQWENGLPLLAKSSDVPLKNLAATDLAHPTGADELSKLADGWFAEASKLPAPDRAGAMRHAGALYTTAEATATGLEAKAIEKRLAQVPPPSRHRRVDLIDLFDPANGAIKGTWHVDDGSLFCDPADLGRANFLFEPPEEYDFRITFTITRGEGDTICQMCYCAGHQFMFALGGWGNKISAFENINGAGGPENKTAKRKDHWLNKGQKYVSVVKVRRDHVEAYLDGLLVTGIKTDYSNMSLNNVWGLSRPNVVGIDANGVRFDYAEIVEITGEGKILSP